MKKLPIGMQTFAKLIEGNRLYIDKTKDIYNLLTGSGEYYFLSRPRRFGKSLLVSTLKEIFSGNKALFKGLWIYDKIEWRTHPIIHLDLSVLSYDTDEALKKSLEDELAKIAREQHIQLTSLNYKTQFNELIEKLSPQGRVVILVDEYDKPIIDKIDRKEIVEANREVLKDFYSVIKGADRHIQFVLLTGVSKFSRVSVFSGLNNLNDITLDPKFSTMLGYTQEEVETYFHERIEIMSQTMNIDKPNLLKEIKLWYNGYSWDGTHFVYNPFSILYLFEKEQFDNYWFSTGTPTFLVKLLKQKKTMIPELENRAVDHSIIDSYEVDRVDAIPLLFQTGYLTIKKVEKVPQARAIKVRNKYILSYPNEEVKEAFLKYLLAGITESSVADLGDLIYKLLESISHNKLETFFAVLKSVFASIPNAIFIKDRESYYHTVIYLTLSLLGVNIKSELQTNTGRIDAVLQTGTHVYVMEFKLGSADKALAQIKEKRYYEPYLHTSKAISLIGVGFDVEQKNISAYLHESLEPSNVTDK